MTARQRIALVGAPNSGKSTLFNRLTGANQRIGNFPGVTVERKEGVCRLDGRAVTVIDLPGLYSIAVPLDEEGLDHFVARDYLARHGADIVVSVVDATRLEQSLYLTVQLLEMGLPVVVALNMVDAAADLGLAVDAAALAARLGVPVVPMAAAGGMGVDDLKRLLAGGPPPPCPGAVPFDAAVEAVVTDLAARLGGEAAAEQLPARWLATRLLEGDRTLLAAADAEIAAALERGLREIEDRTGEEADSLIADARFGAAQSLAEAVVERRETRRRRFGDLLDAVVLHRWLGVPAFLLVMYALFTFTINVGGAFIDFFDIAVGALLVDGFGVALTALGAPEWLRVVLADGAGGGIQVVATFIPIVGALFLALTFLEDSGYMARAAFVMDKATAAIGLPGKAIVPLIVGFGCNVPGVMASRVLERAGDRIITIAMTPFMSCGARLAVYALFVAAFFPSGGQNVVFGLYLAGVLAAGFTALVLKRTLVPGEASPLIIEVPPYRLPRPRDLLLHSWARLKSFIVEAGRVIVVVVMVLNVLGAVGTDGSFGHENAETSVLSTASRAVTPVFAPMGVREDNWPAVVGIVTGIFAKEAVVGTLDALYGAGVNAEAAEADLVAAFGEALASIPENLGRLGTLLLDPVDLTAAEADAAAAAGTVEALRHGFDGTLGAVAYLLFVLLYVPCLAVLGAIYRELGGRWAVFVACWTTGLAYVVATVAYQAGSFALHPGASGLWIAGAAAALAAFIAGLRHLGRRGLLVGRLVPAGAAPSSGCRRCPGCDQPPLAGR